MKLRFAIYEVNIMRLLVAVCETSIVFSGEQYRADCTPGVPALRHRGIHRRAHAPEPPIKLKFRMLQPTFQARAMRGFARFALRALFAVGNRFRLPAVHSLYFVGLKFLKSSHIVS